MKKKILLAVTILMLLSCNSPDKYEEKKENGMNYTVMIIEGCEYIWYKDDYNYGQTLAHKGNCANSIHYQYQIDSAEIAVGYLRSNGAFQD